MLPGISQRLLVGQNIPADAVQPTFALIQDGINGVQAPASLVGIAACCTEKLGLVSTNHHVSWAPGVVEGEVTIEVADEVNYVGAWTPLAVVTFAGSAPKQDVVTIDGGYGAYRHRITAIVEGGSVTTKIVGTV